MLINCKGHSLIWPEDQTEYRKILTVQRQNLDREVEPQHQADAERRDRLQQDWRPRKILQKRDDRQGSTWKKDQAQEYEVMDRELQNKTEIKDARTSRPPRTSQKINIDICGISGEAFQTNLYRKENTFFSTSLYEIDQIIQEKEQSREPGEQQENKTEL